MPRLALDPDRIAELIHGGLADTVGSFCMGVHGALAEFAVVGDEAVQVRRSGPGGRTVEAVTAGGGIRLIVSDDTVAFGAGPGRGVVLAVPRSVLPGPSLKVRAVPADRDALRPQDEKAVLVDLAIGHSAAAFCVRTADPDLVATLRAAEGCTWEEALDRVGHLLVAASPHRVVTGPLGRIEVYNPIPQEWHVSPDGCHTHLLPQLLRTGRETADGDELPSGLVAAAYCPNARWE